MNTIGFQDITNVIKYSKITGEMLANADEYFFSDVLGIVQEVEQDKLRFEIGKINEKQIGVSKLWGWGNNKFGQLGIYGPNNIHETKQIPIPNFIEGDTKSPHAERNRDYIV